MMQCLAAIPAGGVGLAIPLQRAHIRVQGFSSYSRVLVPALRCVGDSSISSRGNLITKVSREDALKCNKNEIMSMRKGKLSSLTPGSQGFLHGEGMKQLGLDISRSSSCHKTGRKAMVTCRVAGAAVPGDASNGINDYLPNFTDKSLPLRIRAICFYLWTFAVAFPLFFVMLGVQPFVLLLDKYRRKVQHIINRIWASLTILLFYKAEIIGRENLPSSDEAAVYVANHQSFLDIYTLFLLGRPFKFISKTSNFLIPIIGWSMYLTGHVPLRRLDKRSQLECLKKCIELVKKGVPVLFFPEGSRTSDGKMAAFKKGAFNVATKGNVPVVPIALIGTGKLMPNGLESTLRPGRVKVIIHPPIQGGNADELCNEARDTIAQTLLRYGMPVA
ncbi:unnamed protein product [Calypogeia fissa]